MPPRIAFFSMQTAQHFHRLRSLVRAVAARDVEAYVFTDAAFRPDVERAGAHFVDLFAGRPYDDESEPLPIRFVAFGATHVESVARELAALRPSLVVYGQFAVVGRFAAHVAGVPAVNLCAGHAADPARFARMLAHDPRVAISKPCR